MTFVRRRGVTRRAAVAVACGLLTAGAVAGAAPAAAAAPSGEDAQPPGGAAATLDGLRTYGEAVVREPATRGGAESGARNGAESGAGRSGSATDGAAERRDTAGSGTTTRTTGAGLFQMAVDGGGTFQTYSVDIDNPTQAQARYEESPAAASSLHGNRDAGKIRWILRHSYPQRDDLQKLARSAGAKQLTPGTAAAGTQVAIWRFSDPRFRGGKGGSVEAADPSAEKLADHLVKAARDAPEPAASLTLDRSAVAGKAGGLLGPVTVHTRERSVSVASAPGAATRGVKVVDGGGKPVDQVRNGSKLYFAVPGDTPPGSTSLTVQAATEVPVGRVLSAAGGEVRSPTQILAGASWSTVSATATAQWAAHGAIPAVTARKDCAKGVVGTTVSNGGDRPFTFGLAGQKHEVAPGGAKTVPVAVQEDQAYRIGITGPHGFRRTFSGVLDCATLSSTQGEAEQRSGTGGAVPQLTRPATVGGAGVAHPAEDAADLAQTGSSGSTPMVIGVAIALVVVGAGAVLLVRRHDAGSAGPGGTEGEE